MDATVIGVPLASLSIERLYRLRDLVNAEITRRQAPPQTSLARCSGTLSRRARITPTIRLPGSCPDPGPMIGGPRYSYGGFGGGRRIEGPDRRQDWHPRGV